MRHVNYVYGETTKINIEKIQITFKLSRYSWVGLFKMTNITLNSTRYQKFLNFHLFYFFFFHFFKRFLSVTTTLIRHFSFKSLFLFWKENFLNRFNKLLNFWQSRPETSEYISIITVGSIKKRIYFHKIKIFIQLQYKYLWS